MSRQTFQQKFGGAENVYKRGIAVGMSDIVRDEITFRFRDELFTFPTIAVIHVARHNGYFYEAKIGELRKLAKGKH